MPGMLESVMSMFSPAGGAKLETPAGTPPPNNPTQVQQPGNPLPGSNPANPAAPVSNEPVNPLDAIKDIWTLPEGTKPPESVADMFKNLDVKKINDSAGQMDFKGVVDQTLLAKINAGGPDATTALLEVMNKMAQKAYAQSAVAGVRITEQAMTKADKVYTDRLPSLVRNANTNDQLRSENELYSHPAMAPVVGALSQQLQAKNPNATAGEIKSQVIDYLALMGKALNPEKPDAGTNSAGRAKEEDWDKFLQ